MNRLSVVTVLLASSVGIAGCADFANTRNFAAVGTVLGAGAGVALGAATGHVGEGVMIGTALGGLGGGMAGSAMENRGRKNAEKELYKGVQQDMLVSKPAGPGHYETAKKSKWIDTSQKKRVWVEEKVADGGIIPAHFEERLIPAGHWADVDEQVWVEDNAAQTAQTP